METTVIALVCAFYAVGTILIIGPGKKSTPVFFTGVVVGFLGTAGMMAYTLISGITPLKIVLVAMWLFVIVTTVGYVIRNRAKQRTNHANDSQ